MYALLFFISSYGDLTGVTPLEKWIAIASMITGVVLFGYILGGLASMLTNADAQRSRFIHRLNAIQDYLKEARISQSLKRKVTGYYEYLVKYIIYLRFVMQCWIKIFSLILHLLHKMFTQCFINYTKFIRTISTCVLYLIAIVL